MIPDIEVQLQVIIKSLKDNVVPAIDTENELAQQQIQLSLAALEITLNNLPMLHRTLRKDLVEHSNVAKQLLNICTDEASKGTLVTAIQCADDALADPENGFIELQQQARLQREAIGTAVANNGESEQAEAIERAILETCDATLVLGRAWNKPMGFEPDPDAVTELTELLSLAK